MRAQAALLLVVWVSVSFAAHDAATPFQTALTEAGKYAIQFDDPASVQKGITLYYAVIAAFPDHPGVYKAKLAVFDILRSEGSERSLSQASQMISELLDEADLNSSVGQDLALKYADFHLEEARGYRFQNIEGTKRVLERLHAQATDQTHSLLLLRVTSREANVLTHEGQVVASLAHSITMLGEANKWGTEDGFWSELFKNDMVQYQEYMEQLSKIASSACWAIERSDDPQISAILRREPIILMQYEIIREAWKNFELKYMVGSPEEIERIQDQLFESIVLSPTLPGKTHTVLGHDSTQDAAMEIALGSQENASQPEERQPVVVDNGQGAEMGAGPARLLGRGRGFWLIPGLCALVVVAVLGISLLKRKA